MGLLRLLKQTEAEHKMATPKDPEPGSILYGSASAMEIEKKVREAQARLLQERVDREVMESIYAKNQQPGVQTTTIYPPSVAEAVGIINALLDDQEGAYDRAMDWVESQKKQYTIHSRSLFIESRLEKL